MKVEIFMSTYNRAYLVKEAIDSVLAQTFKDWKFIIIDDCSHDDTWTTLQKYKSNKVTLIRNETNLTSGPSKNCHMLTSKAKYLAVIDDDDKWEPEYLDILVKALDKNPDCDIAYCDAWREDGKGDRRYWNSSKGKPFPNTLPSCSIYRGDTFRRLEGWDTENFLRYHAEADYYLRIGWPKSFIHIPQPLVTLGSPTGAMSSDKLECAKKELKLIEKHGNSLSNKVIGELYARVGLHMIEADENSKPYFRQALHFNKLSLEAWGGLILSTINKRLFLLVYSMYRRLLGYA